MIDFNTLAEFSRNYCVSICAFLVPANLVTTVLTLLFLYFGRPTRQVFPIASLALLFALTMFLHVATWLMIGVVMSPTFILFGLGLTCFVIFKPSAIAKAWNSYYTLELVVWPALSTKKSAETSHPTMKITARSG
jgi:hypothetical protein